eukprot:3372896-Rhodomonas_salina.1
MTCSGRKRLRLLDNAPAGTNYNFKIKCARRALKCCSWNAASLHEEILIAVPWDERQGKAAHKEFGIEWNSLFPSTYIRPLIVFWSAAL